MYKELKHNFIYLLHPLPAFLITSISKLGKPNVMTASWVIPMSINPPLVVLSLRPERFTSQLIKETKEFVINIPPYELSSATLICGRISGRDNDKFKLANLTPISGNKVKSPVIKECIAHIECTLEDILDIKGDHLLFIGRVVYSQVEEDKFDKIYNLEKFKPSLYLGQDTYTTCKEAEKIDINMG
jgi:flavin reductase (DIM6/NTAB) family NADH-FMN oxidoreductase RutF